jgi:putative SOS response-associated peptidase YedK
MCNLYGHKVTRQEYLFHFSAADRWRRDLEKDYTSPGREGWTVTMDGNERVLTAKLWGFPPPPGVKAPVVNVRNYDSPYWRPTLANPERRCLVPVTRFQEWSAQPDPQTGRKRAYWFRLPSQPIFAFAGIWRPDAKGDVFAFLTCEPNPLVGAIHPKAMPVILHPDDYQSWLDGADVAKFAQPFPSQLMAVE